MRNGVVRNGGLNFGFGSGGGGRGRACEGSGPASAIFSTSSIVSTR